MEQELQDLYVKTIPGLQPDYIPLQLVCDAFSIDYDWQCRILDTDKSYSPFLKNMINEIVFGDKRRRMHLSKKGFLRWIMELSPSLIDENIRESFIEYKTHIVDYIFDFALQQESNIKRAETIKARMKVLYDSLHQKHPEFVEYVDLQAQVARLGKERKGIVDKIASNNKIQIALEL